MSSMYSQTDSGTMEAWVDCLGKDLLCLIQGETLSAWWWSKEYDQMMLGVAEIDYKAGLVVGTYNNIGIN